MSSATKKSGVAASPAPSGPTPTGLAKAAFPGLFGVLFGLSLLKFGNPIIFEELSSWPRNIYEWMLMSWPLVIGNWMMLAVTIVGVMAIQRPLKAPWKLAVLPVLWLLWELVAATHTESVKLTQPTILHFVCCVTCFYLGLFALSGSQKMGSFWAGLIPGLLLVFCTGFEQHFGGLEDSRKYFMYMYGNGANIDPVFLKKISSGRIFGTLLYPNTLAEVILMVLPVTLAVLWSMRERFTSGARLFLISVAAFGGLACLYWSGSKAGWLLMLVIIVIGANFLPIQKQIKVTMVVCVLAMGLAGFTAKYFGYFKKGASSVGARFDYWEAALKTVNAKPVFGTGPGTFGRAYARIKRPESEMAKLAHNDYLEQASDSGLPGCLIYTAMIASVLVYIWRKGRLREDWVRLAVWLGVLGWALHNLMEFGLYIPAVSWTAFGLMGWLLGECGKPFDTSKPASYSGRSR